MRNIVFLGLVSFFTDLSTEMVYPLIPLYLTSAFGATPAVIGVIEGLAESLAGLSRVFSGYLSDKFQKKRALAFAGYAAGLFYKLALLVAGSWVGVLWARVIDRFGKGVRTAPRDVLVSESADAGSMGKAFGLHKALDMAGTALGILITYFLLRVGASGYQSIFLWSLIPAVLGLCLFVFIKEKKAPRRQAERPPLWRSLRSLDGRLKLYLAVVGLFTLGNSSNSFLLLKAKAIGFDDVSVVLLYFVYSLTASLLSVPFGRLSDKLGRKKLLVSGYLLFAGCYLGFALVRGQASLTAVFVLYGAYTAMITGVERAFVAEIAPPEFKGTLLGLHSTVTGVALLPASVIAGALWSAFGIAVPFLFGAALSLTAALTLAFFLRDPPPPSDSTRG
jgi:MFS family permease